MNSCNRTCIKYVYLLIDVYPGIVENHEGG